jgi:rfaE bifunctional protein kinase chain/domain
MIAAQALAGVRVLVAGATLTHVGRMIARAHEAGKPVLVNLKGDDYSRCRGASMITPNRAEFREVVGSWKSEHEFTAKAERLLAELQLQALLVTRSEEGMTLFEVRRHHHVPTRAREVFDVSGAGNN